MIGWELTPSRRFWDREGNVEHEEGSKHLHSNGESPLELYIRRVRASYTDPGGDSVAK